MTKIAIGIFGEQRIICEGIEALFKENNQVEVKFLCFERNRLIDLVKNSGINILIINMYNLTTYEINILAQVNINFHKVKILVLSAHNSEELIYKTIRAGAKGFLSSEADKNELFEAIHTVRNGYDYYSKTITRILLNKYIAKIKSNEQGENANLSSLSSRQVEILKLWGESYSNQEIADKLFISIRTVESHKNHIMQKLNLRTTVDMVKFAIKNNLIEI